MTNPYPRYIPPSGANILIWYTLSCILYIFLWCYYTHIPAIRELENLLRSHVSSIPTSFSHSKMAANFLVLQWSWRNHASLPLVAVVRTSSGTLTTKVALWDVWRMITAWMSQVRLETPWDMWRIIIVWMSRVRLETPWDMWRIITVWMSRVRLETQMITVWMSQVRLETSWDVWQMINAWMSQVGLDTPWDVWQMITAWMMSLVRLETSWGVWRMITA